MSPLLSPARVACLLLGSLLLPSSVLATDTWTNVRPGVDWLHRTTSGSVPQDIQAVRIDLTQGEVGLRASMDVSGERGVGTDTFASNAGTLVAIDGDWSDGYTPVGLAMGNGWLWNDHYDDPNIGATWGTFGCDVWNGCSIESLAPLSSLFAYTPALAPLRYYNAVGTNGLLLLDDGVRLSGCYDGCPGDTCRHPRSAVCLEQGGDFLWFIVVDGRRSAASGMTCSETRDLVEDLGCWDAAMLDGGGSSAIWVDGAIRNQPSDGSPRNVAGSIGITYADTPDAICPFTAGAWCDGSVMRTCNGSLLVNEGDCGAFGLACQEDGDWAYCVNWACPGGDGNGAACTGPTEIESCNDGVYSSGDCAFFGLTCGSDSGGTSCMDPLCTEGPNSSYCVDADTVGSCSAGAYEAVDCGTGELCEGASGTASCVAQGDDDDAVGDDDDAAGDDDDAAGDDDDAVGDDDDTGGDDDDTGGDDDDTGGDDDDTVGDDDDDSSDDDDVSDDDEFIRGPGGTSGLEAPSGCSGCQTSSTGPGAGWLLLVLGLLGRPRGSKRRPEEAAA